MQLYGSEKEKFAAEWEVITKFVKAAAEKKNKKLSEIPIISREDARK